MTFLISNPIFRTAFVGLLVVAVTGCHSRRHARYRTQVQRTPTHYRCVPPQQKTPYTETAPLPKAEMLIKPVKPTPNQVIPKTPEKEMNSVPPKIEPIPTPLKKKTTPAKKKPAIMTPNESYNSDVAPPRKKEIPSPPKTEPKPKRPKRKVEEDKDLFIRKDLPPAPPIEKSPQANRPSSKDLVAFSISHSAARSRERDLVFKNTRRTSKRSNSQSNLNSLPVITPRSENQIEYYQSIPSRNSIPLQNSSANRPLITLEAPIFLETPKQKQPEKKQPPITRIDLTVPQKQFQPKSKSTNTLSVSRAIQKDQFQLQLPSWNETSVPKVPNTQRVSTSRKKSGIQMLLPSRSLGKSESKPEPRKLWFR